MQTKIKAVLLALIVAPALQVHAAQGSSAISLACSANIVDSVNGTSVFKYSPNFAVTVGGAIFSEDVSNVLRFGEFTASAQLNANKAIVVKITYDRDRSVFESGMFSAELPMTNNRLAQSISGQSVSMSSVVNGGSSRFQTDYQLTCQRTN